MKTYLMKHIWLVAALGGLVFVTSCNKTEVSDPSNITSFNDLKVSPTFNWESTREITLTISTELPPVGTLARITIYDGNPEEHGNVLANGSAGKGFSFETQLRIPSSLKAIYASYRDGKGKYLVVAIPVNGNQINYEFKEVLNTGLKNTAVVEPNCNECEHFATGNTPITIKNGEIWCVDNYNGQVTFEFWNGGGTLRICGSATLSNVTLGNMCQIEVLSGASLNGTNIQLNSASDLIAYSTANVNITGLSLNTAGTTVYNYSSNFNINGNLSTNGGFYNYGVLNVTGNYQINGYGGFYFLENQGVVNIGGSFECNSRFMNTGTIEAQGDMNLNGSLQLNYCKLITHNNFNLNSGNFKSYGGYLKVYGNMNINGGTQPELYNQSMWSVNNLTVNSGVIKGFGSLNSIKVANTTTFWSNSNATGAIELADNDGQVVGNQNAFLNGATLVNWNNITNYIPQSACNPEGIGLPSITDTDGDGIADEIDDYPTDPNRAFNNYFPNQNTWGSLAFEDLWPAKGDYDFNDLVTNYQFNLVTNAQNKVVDIKAKLHVKAVGASFQNGFGIQIDGLEPQLVASATGGVLENNYINVANNGLEANQAKAVIIAWDNVESVIHRAGGSMFNTIHNGFTGTADTVNLTITLSTPQEQAVVGTPPYNPFLIRQMNRGHEIHLSDHVPTSLMDYSLFGTGQDASIPSQGIYYKTLNNHPWGLNIPVPFAWPLEKTDITNAHLHFAEWAQSSGTTFADWYLNNAGYRDPSNIY
ncbi:MAG: LruC domain-containing protein [Bacteroidales bacterium]|jgi:LruC domain-containing protein|nr:LruC domain-containing protein [Bacteroidales bacterium]